MSQVIHWLRTVMLLAATAAAMMSCQEKHGSVSTNSMSQPVTARPASDPKTMVTAGFTFPSAPTDEQSRARTDDQLATLNASCVACHRSINSANGRHTDRDSMHTGSVRLACVDCHGGPG